MFAFPIKAGTEGSILEIAGLELEKNDSNNLEVSNLTFMGEAEKIGMDFYDEVTKVEMSTLDRPKKEYVYIFGFFLLLIVCITQNNHSKKKKE